MPEGTLTISVLANTAKIYDREIALGAVPTGQTPEKSWAGVIVRGAESLRWLHAGDGEAGGQESFLYRYRLGEEELYNE